MRGPKLNEGATVATMERGERHGTKATAKYVRSSAYKARAVLDLIRGLDVRRADEVLQFTERGIATDVRKVLASAVANATNPNNAGAYIADADELFVLACFADEGPTLRRFSPRARGRATRIRKRTCHITVVVGRMSEQRLAIAQARSEGVSATAAASRRARVERSRQRAQAAKKAGDTNAVAPASTPADEDVIEAVVADEVELRDASDGVVQAAEGSADDEAEAARGGSATDDEPAVERGRAADDEPAIEASGFQAGEWDGSVLADEDGNGPDTHPIKGNADSMLYHTPDSRYYTITKAEVWFDSEEHAEAAGFSKPASQQADEASDQEDNK
jgi:large subunit ribosomal protein L22